MEKQYTCGNCPHMKTGDRPFYTAHCGESGLIIPHNMDCSGDKVKFVFWRIPVDCPIDDESLVKSEKQAHEKYWVKKEMDK